jgi:hypothetical protein
MKRNITIYSCDRKTKDIINGLESKINDHWHRNKKDYIDDYSKDSLVKYEVTITVTEVKRAGDPL